MEQIPNEVSLLKFKFKPILAYCVLGVILFLVASVIILHQQLALTELPSMVIYPNYEDTRSRYIAGLGGEKSRVSGEWKKVETVTLLFVGDIMLSRSIGNLMEKKGDWRYPFLETADFLKNVDLTVGNLEGPISSRGKKVGSIYSFRADPRAVEGLLYAGFDILSIANNHIWDYGFQAVYDTIALLRGSGLGVIGGGADFAEAHRSVIENVKGVKIVFFGYTDLIPPLLGQRDSRPAIAYLNLEQAIADIAEARKAADLVVVSLHWGSEYETVHNSVQELMAKKLIDAGVHLVVGHHPHVIQPVEEYNGGYIAYSLGNFVFDQNFSKDTREGLVLKVVLKDKKIDRVEQLKVAFNASFQPFLVSGPAEK